VSRIFQVLLTVRQCATSSTMHFSLFLGALLSLATVNAGLVPKPAKSCTIVQKPNPKSGLRCGWHGPLDPTRISALSSPVEVKSVASCADLCRSNHQCISFGLTGDQCQLYNKSLINMNITPPNMSNNTSTTFYNRGCWQQQCSIAPGSCLCTAKVTGIILLSNDHAEVQLTGS
jgi:hypothetical protein